MGLCFTKSSCCIEIDQRKARVSIELPIQELRRFDEYQFKSGKDMSFQEVPAMSRAIRFTHDDVRVNFGNITFNRDIAGQRKHFHLLPHRNSLVILFRRIEEADNDVAERSNRGEMTR